MKPGNKQYVIKNIYANVGLTVGLTWGEDEVQGILVRPSSVSSGWEVCYRVNERWMPGIPVTFDEEEL